jgi:hypothetical protein
VGAVVSRGVLLSHYGRQNAQALLQSGRSSLVQGGFVLWDFLNQTGRAHYKHAPENKTYFQPDELCAMAINAGFHTTKTLGESSRRVGLLLSEC